MHIKQFIFNPIQENTYVIYDDCKNGILIDVGCVFENEKTALKNFIEHEQLLIKRILCTHLHFDHILGADYAEKTFQVKTYAHKDDLYWLHNMSGYAGIFGVDTSEKPIELAGYLQEGDQIKEGNLYLEVLHVPGHSPGGLAFYAPHDKVVFTGDSLFEGSIGRTDFKGGSQSDLVENIKQKLWTLPDDTIVYPGHGPTTSIGFEKLNNPYII